MSAAPVQSSLRFPSRRKSLPVQQGGYARSDLASGPIILEAPERYGTCMVTWARRIVEKAEPANRSES